MGNPDKTDSMKKPPTSFNSKEIHYVSQRRADEKSRYFFTGQKMGQIGVPTVGENADKLWRQKKADLLRFGKRGGSIILRQIIAENPEKLLRIKFEIRFIRWLQRNVRYQINFPK